MQKEITFCPVCGYDLGFPAWKADQPSDEICPSCGIQFGYTDAAGGNIQKRIEIYKEWRNNWIRNGMIWDKGLSSPPKDWNPKKQLENVPEVF